jgi:hypothetical protein
MHTPGSSVAQGRWLLGSTVDRATHCAERTQAHITILAFTTKNVARMMMETDSKDAYEKLSGGIISLPSAHVADGVHLYARIIRSIRITDIRINSA